MRGTIGKAAILGIGLALAVLAALASDPSERAADALQEKILIGIDANPDGNAAASLGNIDTCVSVQTGRTFDVDIFIEHVVELGGWQALFHFNPAVVQLASMDIQLFMAGAPGASLIDLSETPGEIGPSETGVFSLAVIDFGPGPGESGAGILARLTLEATASGVSNLELDEIVLLNSQNEVLESTGPDNIYRGAISNAAVAVDAPCSEQTASPTPRPSPTSPAPTAPTTATPTPTAGAASPPPVGTPSPTPPTGSGNPSADEDDGFPWAVAGGVAGGVAAVAVLGLLLGWRFRRARVR